MKAALLVNGVPASGKSTVARALAEATGWPLLALDTVKEAFFTHLGTGDRAYNRKLGRASYDAIFAAVGDFPDGVTVIVDAWFGFQPDEILHANLARAKITRVAELWCHAPPLVIGARYQARLGQRSAGHLGAEYVPELIALAGKAKSLGAFPVFEIDTTTPLGVDSAVAFARGALSQAAGAQARR
jgi:predicted kinase